MTASTKEKIREIAHELFANKGYEAVSIRDIAKVADVNISAINYHFENKLGLYHSVINHSMTTLTEDLETISKDNSKINTVDYIALMYDYLIKNKSRTISCFKFFMSMSEILKELEVDCMQDETPPGGEVLAELLKREVPNISDEDLEWVIRSMCALVFHKAMVACNNGMLCEKITPELLKADLCRASKVMIQSLK